MSREAFEKSAASESAAATERELVDSSVRRVYRLIEDHIESVGGMDTAAGLCGVKRWDLRRALDRGDRYLPVDHALAIASRMRFHNAGIATEIGAALVRPIDLLVFPRVTLTPEEELKRVKRMLLAMPMGEQLYAKAVETP